MASSQDPEPQARIARGLLPPGRRLSPVATVPVAVPRPLIRWAFALFVFGVPFETVDIGIRSGNVTLSKLIGYGFFALCLLQPRTCFRRPPRALWFFALYVLYYALAGLYQPDRYWPLFVEKLLKLVQMLVLLWVAFTLLRHDRVVRSALGALAAACTTLSVLAFFGVTASSDVHYGKRVSILGEDPNTAASVLSLGLLAMVGLAYGQRHTRLRTGLLAWLLVPPVAIAIVQTGSRGGLVALAAGLLVIVLRSGKLRTRVRNGLVVLAVFGVLIWSTVHSEWALQRWELTMTEGSMAGRERIYPAAWKMFLEKPLLGWGPVRHYFALGSRLGAELLDTHNLYLWVLTEVGLLGAIPYFAALASCAAAAWRGRRGPQGVLPLALFVMVMVVNLSLTWQGRKLHWLILGFALASAVPVLVRRRTREPRRLPLLGGIPSTAQPALGSR